MNRKKSIFREYNLLICHNGVFDNVLIYIQEN